MRLIETENDIADGLNALCRMDPRLAAVRVKSGAIPLRRSPAGFESLVSIVVSQQVSRASADAIYGRLVKLMSPLTADAILGADDNIFHEAGLSRPKQKTMRAIAGAVVDDGLDLDAMCSMNAADAIARMTAISGIGPWTAEVYLLVCAGHPDIFPAKDVALQAAVAHALGHEHRPSDKALYAIAESWTPWRSVAARLFWSYYRELRGRDAALGR